MNREFIVANSKKKWYIIINIIIFKGKDGFMLEKGTIIWIQRDNLDFYLQERICDDDRLSLMRIVDFCFDNKAAAVALFINCRNGNHNCAGYMPIFDKKTLFNKFSKNFKDIEDSIYLGAFLVDDIDQIEDKEIIYVMKERAVRMSFWHEDFSILIFR